MVIKDSGILIIVEVDGKLNMGLLFYNFRFN